MSGNHFAATAAFLIALAPTMALADGRLQLIIGGEAYDGPPKFEVTFDGTVLGESAVTAAIDTGTAGRFADATDKTPYVQAFEFTIPEAVFNRRGEVRVRLTNEAYGGDGSNRDRNLYLAAVAVNGQPVTASGFSTITPDGPAENNLLGEFLVLADGNEQGAVGAPGGGWPLPVTTIALAKPASAAEIEPAAVEEVALVEEVAVKKPLAVRAVIVPKAAAEEDEGAVLTASLETGTTASGCAIDEIYNVVGFNENSNDLTPRLTDRLDQIIEDIGENACTVLVTGYSSTQGSHATNALFAVERAQNVLAYLKQQGMSFRKVNATGAGATAQFGDDFASNRRVVITVLP